MLFAFILTVSVGCYVLFVWFDCGFLVLLCLNLLYRLFTRLNRLFACLILGFVVHIWFGLMVVCLFLLVGLTAGVLLCCIVLLLVC